MAYATATLHDINPAAGLVARLRDGLAAYRVYRKTLGELAALTDRELADLGISRFNIAEVARGAVYGR